MYYGFMRLLYPFLGSFETTKVPETSITKREYDWQTVRMNKFCPKHPTECAYCIMSVCFIRPLLHQNDRRNGIVWKIQIKAEMFRPFGILWEWYYNFPTKGTHSKYHSNTTYKLMLLTCQNVIAFALLIYIRVRMFEIYWAFCESHPWFVMWWGNHYFYQKITYIFMDESKTA